MKDHRCKRAATCCCSIQALESDDTCPIHSGGEWPPRCEVCGKFLPWPEVRPMSEWSEMFGQRLEAEV